MYLCVYVYTYIHTIIILLMLLLINFKIQKAVLIVGNLLPLIINNKYLKMAYYATWTLVLFII